MVTTEQARAQLAQQRQQLQQRQQEAAQAQSKLRAQQKSLPKADTQTALRQQMNGLEGRLQRRQLGPARLGHEEDPDPADRRQFCFPSFTRCFFQVVQSGQRWVRFSGDDVNGRRQS